MVIFSLQISLTTAFLPLFLFYSLSHHQQSTWPASVDAERFHSGCGFLSELYTDEHGMEGGRTGRLQRCRATTGEQQQQRRASMERCEYHQPVPVWLLRMFSHSNHPESVLVLRRFEILGRHTIEKIHRSIVFVLRNCEHSKTFVCVKV